MRTRAAVVVAAVFLSLGSALCAPAGAVEPAVLAAFERSLDPLEKAILASVLSNPANDAEFTADMVEARRDAAGLQAAYAKWRMKIAQFATSDRNAPNPNLEGTYRTYPEMLTPAIRGYLSRRLRDLRERGAAGDRQAQEAFDTLRDYLASVQSSLDDDGKLSWYTKRVVAGIMDRYRSELVEYLGTANARNGLRDGPAAAETLQRRRQAASTAAQEEEQRRRQAAAAAEAERQRVERERQDAERRRREQASAPVGGEPAEPAPPVREEPVREQPRPEPVVPPREPVVTETPEQRTAREQAEAAERTARAGAPGQVFDGGGLVVGEPPVGGGVAVPPGEAGQRAGSGLAPSTGQNGPGGGLVGSVPSPGADDELLSSIRGGPSGRGSKNWMEKIPAVAGIVLGAVIGLLVAGPLGLVIGGLLGLFAGNWAGKKLLQ